MGRWNNNGSWQSNGQRPLALKKDFLLWSWGKNIWERLFLKSRNTWNPGPGQVFKPRFVPSRIQKMTWPRHICAKFQGKKRYIFGSIKENFSETSVEASYRTWNVTFCDENVIHFCSISSPSPTQNQVYVLGIFRLGTTLTLSQSSMTQESSEYDVWISESFTHGSSFLGPQYVNSRVFPTRLLVQRLSWVFATQERKQENIQIHIYIKIVWIKQN